LDKVRPRIQQIVDGLLIPHTGEGAMEAIADFYLSLPAIVIAEMLGVPAEDAATLPCVGAAISPGC